MLGVEAGGATVMMLRFALESRRRGHEVHVCAFRDGSVARDVAPHGLPYHLARRLPGGNMWNRINAIRRMTELLRDLKPDVVHSHTYFPDIMARPAAKRAGVPVIVTSAHTDMTGGAGLAGGGWPGRNWVIPKLVEATDHIAHRIYATSSEIKQSLIRQGVEARKIICVFNEIDYSRYADSSNREPIRQAAREELDLGSSDFVIGTTGRLVQVKQIDLIIQAVARLKKDLSDIKLVIMGDGSERSALEALCERLQLRNEVRFTGWRDDVPRLLKALDVFVIASRMESTCLSLLEAMASGCACVASRVGGIPDILQHEGLGLMFRKGSVDELALQLQRLHQDVDLRARIITQGGEHVKKHHNLARGRAVDLILNDYRLLLENAQK